MDTEWQTSAWWKDVQRALTKVQAAIDSGYLVSVRAPENLADLAFRDFMLLEHIARWLRSRNLMKSITANSAQPVCTLTSYNNQFVVQLDDPSLHAHRAHTGRPDHPSCSSCLHSPPSPAQGQAEDASTGTDSDGCLASAAAIATLTASRDHPVCEHKHSGEEEAQNKDGYIAKAAAKEAVQREESTQHASKTDTATGASEREEVLHAEAAACASDKNAPVILRASEARVENVDTRTPARVSESRAEEEAVCAKVSVLKNAVADASAEQGATSEETDAPARDASLAAERAECSQEVAAEDASAGVKVYAEVAGAEATVRGNSSDKV